MPQESLEAHRDNPLNRHHSSDCEVLAVTNATGQFPSPKMKKKAMAPLSVEKGLAGRDELRYDKNTSHSRAKKIKYYVSTTIYSTISICALWALAIRGSSGCGDDRSALASIPFIVTFFTMSAIPYAFILTSATSRSAEARHLYIGAFIVALAILIFSSWE